MLPSSVRENGTPQCSSSYTASGALRQRYSIESWSPSQSEPLTVSYMCQRQSSGPMLPSAAEMPPCAATVCERVGNTLVTQAVRRPACAKPGAAGADDHDVEAVVDDRIGAAIRLRRRDPVDSVFLEHEANSYSTPKLIFRIAHKDATAIATA